MKESYGNETIVRTLDFNYKNIYIYIYIYMCVCVCVCMCVCVLPHLRGVDLSSEGINGYHSCVARLFEWIELSVAVKRIYVSKTKMIYMRLKSFPLR